jgi:hypothetical protein
MSGTTVVGTGSTYVVQESDEGNAITVVATAKNDNGATASATSSATAKVTDAAPTLSVTVNGTAQQGQILTAIGLANSADATIKYQWQVLNGTTWANITGATNATYAVTEANESHQLRVIATSSDADGGGTTATSAATTAVTDAPPTLAVTVSGTAQEGKVLTATAGPTSDGDGGTITYQWQELAGSNWVAITGATHSTYTVAEATEGLQLRVVTTFTDDTGQTASATSAATSTVLDAAPTVTKPTITGMAREGQTLTASATAGQSDNGVTYQWYDNGTAISGATGMTYVVQESDEGKRLTVIATAKNDNGVTTSATSSATPAVTDAAPTVTTPTITGTAQEGQVLVATAKAGESDDTVSYQWQSSSNGGSTWTNISGAGSSSYTVREADETHLLRVVATATNDNNVKISATSAPTVAVTDMPLAPAILAGTNTSGSPNGTATFTVLFAEAVTGLTKADFSVFGTANSGTTPTIQSVSASSGTSFTLTVTYQDSGPGSHQGQSLGLNFVNNTGVHETETGETGNLAISTNLITPQFSSLAPAGVAGQPINLGLSGLPSASTPVNVIVSGLANGWTVNGAIKNADGSWSITTNDPASLTVTPPSTFAGATVLQVSETWTNADGSAGNAVIADNIEAYAPGSPIFATSGDDHLTGGSGNDLFVFSNPIGTDTIDRFNAASDKIDLVGFANLTSFANVEAHLSQDAEGDAVITTGTGETITLDGVSSASLSASNFIFDQTPVTNNAGMMTIGNGAVLPLGGIVNNNGTIALNSTGTETDLEEQGLTLQGGGKVVLSDSAQNIIYGTGADVTLTNVDNTISGAGQLGEGHLNLLNDATIDATGKNALVIDTASNAIANSGTLEATGSGGLVIDSAVQNTGNIWANGGNVTAQGAVTGNGSAEISGSATLEFGGASSENTSFAAGATGTLKLDHAESFAGTISGFGAGDALDLADIAFGANTTLGYSANAAGTGGSLNISDGTHSVSIALLGQFSAAGFHVGGDKGAGMMVTYTPPDQPAGTLITPPKA